jgi:catechol 2,3-dioxygenase-like lactoylglutathione lyase family enzyme
MSTAEGHNTGHDAAAAKVGMHLEVEIIPVSDLDRSKQFYQRLGWRLDGDVAPLDGLRIVQLTLRAPQPRSPSAPDLRRPRRARPRGG